MPSPSYQDMIRAFRMLILLLDARDQSLPVNRIAERLDVHRRTVKRYIDALSVLAVDGETLFELERRYNASRGHHELWVRLTTWLDDKPADEG